LQYIKVGAGSKSALKYRSASSLMRRKQGHAAVKSYDKGRVRVRFAADIK
jgi:hypothetical protein